MSPRPTPFVAARQGNEQLWDFLGAEKPPLEDGRQRDPYMEEGCHPDVVERIWDVLGGSLTPACRAQARGIPVLAHPGTGRVFAAARGTAYALWLTLSDFLLATTEGLTTEHRWAGGRVTDLRLEAGDGWVWGAWHAREIEWVRHAHHAGGPAT